MLSRGLLALAGIPTLCASAGFDWHASPNRPLLFWFQQQQAGTLSRELGISTSRQIEELAPATPEQRAALPVAPGEGDRVSAGATWFRKKDEIQLAIVEPANG